MEKIRAAAIKLPDGTIHVGKHHGDVVQSFPGKGVVREDAVKGVQGFMTTSDRFVERYEASKLAFQARQVPEFTGCLDSTELILHDENYGRDG